MRRIATALVAAIPATALFAGTASAQTYTPTEFQEFLINAKELHGKRVQMHATFNSDQAVYSGSFGEDFFKANGIKESNHYRFSVVFRNESKQWLYPVMERKGKSHAIWKQVGQLTKGEKVTLFGRLKLMGDGSKNTYVPGRETSGGGWAEVPSVIKVEKIMRGWVKTHNEYIQDLGGDAKLVDETILMLRREGPGVLPLLVKVSQSSQFSDTIRANAARAIGEFKSASQLGKLKITIKKAGDSEKIKNAAIRAMALIKTPEALKHLGELAGRKDRDDWVPYGAAELLAGGYAKVPELEKAMGDAWKDLSPDLADALLEAAEDAFDKKEWNTAEGYATQAISVDATSGAAYHLRGKSRMAQAAKRPEAKRLAGEDYSKALELGEESPELYLHRGKQLLEAGDKQQAAEMAELVLEEDPKNVEALKLRARAEGKSEAMIDSRLAKMNGVAVRVPSTWKNLDAYVSFKHKLFMYLMGQDHPTQANPRPPATTLRVFVYDDPKVIPEGSRLSTPAETIDARVEANKFKIVERGKLKRADGLECAWAVTEGGEGAQKVHMYWAVVRIKGKVLEALYASDPATLKAQLPTIKESAATLQWTGE